MEPRELLKAQVDVMAALGKLVATVTVPHRDMGPRSLYEDLKAFIQHLRDTQRHPSDTSLEHLDVTTLGQALATLGTTPGATWASVGAAARAWRESVAALEDRWDRLVEEAANLLDDLEDEATAEATATAQAMDLLDQATSWGTAKDKLMATAQQPLMVLATDNVAAVVDMHDAQVAAATTATEEVAACDRARPLPRELHRQLGDIDTSLAKTKEASTDVLEALVATVAEAELLWETSGHLATLHLQGTLGYIHTLLVSRLYGPTGPAGPLSPGSPSGFTLEERCQIAIKNIPSLLGEQ